MTTLEPCDVYLARTSPLRSSGESSLRRLRWTSLLRFCLLVYCSANITNYEVLYYYSSYESMTDGLALSQHLWYTLGGSDINTSHGWKFCTSYPIHNHVVSHILPCSHSLLHCCSCDEPQQLSVSTIMLPMPPKRQRWPSLTS